MMSEEYNNLSSLIISSGIQDAKCYSLKSFYITPLYLIGFWLSLRKGYWLGLGLDIW